MLAYVINCLKQCPFLDGVLLTADFLGETDSLGVFAVSSDPILERYADGGSLKQFVFRLTHRSGGNRLHSEEETAFYETLGFWLTCLTLFPPLGGGREAQYFEIIKTGAIEDRSHSSDRYGMECRLIYYSEKGSET